MTVKIRGAWFNSFEINKTQRVESYSLKSPLIKKPICETAHFQTLIPKVRVNSARYRHIWNIPKKVSRLINANQEIFDESLAKKYAAMLSSHIKYSKELKEKSPLYIYINCLDKSKNHRVMNSLIKGNPWIYQVIENSLNEVLGSNKYPLHGR